jgi:hypothetical protein
VLGRPAFMTKIIFFPIIATSGTAMFYFSILTLLLPVHLTRIA